MAAGGGQAKCRETHYVSYVQLCTTRGRVEHCKQRVTRPAAGKCRTIQQDDGSLNNANILIKEASKANVVIHTTESAEHVPPVKAILERLIKRDDNPVYIHINIWATSVFASDARGASTGGHRRVPGRAILHYAKLEHPFSLNEEREVNSKWTETWILAPISHLTLQDCQPPPQCP
ncbi:hypothetical protein BU17DRAFT_64609 [Hysterangium stoloniferum]|nr:hypothetical protein BU17DRAFT_64609 [Hysterangium stoloniferum]